MTRELKYTSENGFTGVLGGASSMCIYDKEGKEVMHSGFSNINTLEELKQLVDEWPEYIQKLQEIVKNTSRKGV